MLFSKYILNFKNFVKITVFVIFFVMILSINITYNATNTSFETNEFGLVYDGGNLVLSSTDIDDISDGVDTFNGIVDNESGGVLNTSIYTGETYVEFANNEESLSDYLTANSRYLEEGYQVVIDDNYFYITDESFITWAQNKIIEQLLQNNKLYQVYLANGEVPDFEIDGKVYSNFKFVNNIEIEEKYVPSSKIIETQDEFMYALLHNGDEKEVVYLAEDYSLSDIKKDYNLSDMEFNLNNPTMSSDQLLSNGTPIIVNKLNPIIKVSYTYDYDQNEKINYDTEYIDDNELAEGKTEVRTSGVNGSERVSYQTTLINGKEVNTSRVKSVVTKKPVTEVIANGTLVIPDVGTGKWYWPASSNRVTNDFYGWSVTGRAYHGALDIQSYYGAPIYAADNGVVTIAGQPDSYSGNCVEINHQNGYTTRYCHMSAFAVGVGETVTRGQVIGYEGKSGYTTGEHVHFQMKNGGVAVNPCEFYQVC